MSSASKPEQIKLVPVDRSHLPAIRSWLLDGTTREQVGTIRPPSDVEHEEWHQRITHEPSSYTMAIVDTRSSVPLGICGISDIHPVYRTGELWIYLGELRGQRIGSAAVTQLLRAAFHDLGLHRITVRVFAFNGGAERFFRACGFVDEGRLREAVFKRGSFHDVVLLGMLARDFA